MQDRPLPEDLPVGLMMRLSQNPNAMQHFFDLPDEQQQRMLDSIRASQTGAEARSRIEASMQQLGDEPFSHQAR